MITSEEQARLDELSQEANLKQNIKTSENNIVNQSIPQLFRNMAQTFVDIINELFHVRTPADVVRVFAKDDRLIYVGLLLVFTAVFMHAAGSK